MQCHAVCRAYVCEVPSLQVVASADVFGIYQEVVQQHLDDAFANKGHPDASPQFTQANPGPFTNSALAPAHPSSVPEPPASQPHPQPQPASESTEDVASLSTADPQMQDPAAPAAAAAPAADHTPAELPEGPAQDAAAATATLGIPTAIVPTDNSVVVEAVTMPAAPDHKSDGNIALFLSLTLAAVLSKAMAWRMCATMKRRWMSTAFAAHHMLRLSSGQVRWGETDLTLPLRLSHSPCQHAPLGAS